MIELQPIHDAPTSFFRKYLWTYDHKTIAKQFLFTGLFFLAIGGSLAMFIRWQWATVNSGAVAMPIFGNMFFADTDGIITPFDYTQLFTNHGLIMIFWAITPLLIGAFGNFVIPLQIGARDMAFPWLNALSFWVFALSGILVLASFFTALGPASAGWTTYPPLSTNVGSPGLGQTLMIAAIFVTGVASIMGGINYVITVIRLRAPGMTWGRLPFTVWGLWLTSILNVIFVPVLGSAGLLVLFDRIAGTEFFIAGANGNGDPILFQHLFWIFGHPEVYILILPVWGIVGDLLSYFARKPAFWYKGTVFGMLSVTVISAVVYGHHMYQAGLSPLLGQAFMFLTLLISVPAMVLVFNFLLTIWQGSIRFTPPMLFALGTVFVFGVGGLTGIALGTQSTDIYLHDTMYVVGHFHFTFAAASFLGTVAGLYYWFPKMFGRMLSWKIGGFELADLHFWGSLLTITLTFTGQLIAGWAGQPRRLWNPYNYTLVEHLVSINVLTTVGAFLLFGFQILFAVILFRSLWAGEEAGDNPWEVGTLEWDLTSPPVHYNFKTIPTVYRGPHEFSNPALEEALGRDWISQTEPLPAGVEEPLGAEYPTQHQEAWMKA